MSLILFALSTEGLTLLPPGFLNEIMEQYGLHPEFERSVTVQESQEMARYLAPNLWKSAFCSGSSPRIGLVIGAYDLAVTSPNFTQRYLYPEIDNARLLLFAYHCQKAINAHRPGLKLGDVLCSTANGDIARLCLMKLWPDDLTRIEQRIAEGELEVRSRFPVLRELTRTGIYAKVYLIDYYGTPAVEKIYRPRYRSRLEREKLAYGLLAESIDAIPKALSIDGNSLILPYIKPSAQYDPSGWKLVPIKKIRQIVAALKQLYEAGYAVIDAHAGNCIFDAADKLWMIDFEFLYRYSKRPKNFLQSFDMSGIPDHFDGETPPGSPPYLTQPWLDSFGVPAESVVSDTILSLHFRRMAYWAVRKFPVYLYRQLRTCLRFSLAVICWILQFLPPRQSRSIWVEMRP